MSKYISAEKNNATSLLIHDTATSGKNGKDKYRLQNWIFKKFSLTICKRECVFYFSLLSFIVYVSYRTIFLINLKLIYVRLKMFVRLS